MSGQHAFFIWGSYGALALAIAIELWSLRQRRRKALIHALRAKQAAKRMGSSRRFEEHA